MLQYFLGEQAPLDSPTAADIAHSASAFPATAETAKIARSCRNFDTTEAEAVAVASWPGPQYSVDDSDTADVAVDKDMKKTIQYCQEPYFPYLIVEIVD